MAPNLSTRPGVFRLAVVRLAWTASWASGLKSPRQGSLGTGQNGADGMKTVENDVNKSSWKVIHCESLRIPDFGGFYWCRL